VLDLSFRFDRWIDALPKSPADAGRVERCVLRTGRGQRASPERVELRVGAGVVGDAWFGHEHSLPENEVALMNVHVLRAVCEGDEARMPLSGDNLLVDLDLSEANLPVGTRLCVGEAVLCVSPFPHRPCDKFVARFGARAAKRVARANRRGLRGRGVLCTVERGGGVAVGDTIRVERP
jgi:MOSC domain-containing protein YiiM